MVQRLSHSFSGANCSATLLTTANLTANLPFRAIGGVFVFLFLENLVEIRAKPPLLMSQKEERISIETALKERTLRQLRTVSNPLVFRRIQAVLRQQATLDQIQHISVIRELLQLENQEDYQVRIRQPLARSTALRRYDMATAPFMFYVGVISLLLIGALVTILTEDHPSSRLQNIFPWIVGLTAGMYGLSVADVLLLFYRRRKHQEKIYGPEKRMRLFSVLFPPLHIGTRDSSSGKYLWIPFWHWCVVNEGLLAELKRKFVLPMIGIALLIVPVLVIEWKFLDEVREELPNLRINLILNTIQIFIWSAFTFEFILMISISNRKFHYIKKNWIDLLIILLPFVSFLRSFRISQLARLKYATRSFKLRGVITKARQGLIFVDVVQRLFRLRPENEMKRLYRLLQENRRDSEELLKKLEEVAHLIEKKNAQNHSPGTSPQSAYEAQASAPPSTD